jgi:hypothetical protein
MTQPPEETSWRASLSASGPEGERHIVQYVVDFIDPRGEVTWWQLFFIEIEEATRWTEWELDRVADGEAGWIGRVDRGHWRDRTFVLDVEELVTVGPSTGAPTAAGAKD